MTELPYLSIQKTTIKVSDFLTWARAGQLDLSPYYQRRSVWKRPAKSLLIDTIMRGLPVPLIIIRDRLQLSDQSVIREVVDGQQRLRTVLTYVGFRPSGAGWAPAEREQQERDWEPFRVLRAHNEPLARAGSFGGLSDPMKSRFLDYQFPVHVLPSSVDDPTVLAMFTRLNSTGQRLKGAELRNATYHGPFASLVKDVALSNIHMWRKWQVLSDTEISRMTELDLAADLCVVMIRQQLYSNTSGQIDQFYKSKESLDELPGFTEIQRRFDAVIHQLDRSIPEATYGTSVTNRIIFSSVWIAFYDAMFGLSTPVIKRAKESKIPSGMSRRFEILDERLKDRESLPADVADATAGASSDVSKRQARLRFVKEILEL